MSKVTYRKCRKDSNHGQIVKLARSLGCIVKDISIVPNSCDILIGYKGKFFPVEIKDGTLSPSKRKLTDGELVWKKELESVGVNYYIIESEQDLIDLLNKM